MTITPRFLINNYKNSLLQIRRYSPVFKCAEKILNLTDPAFDQLKVLKQKFPEKKLRIAIEAGGCQGFQYKYSFDLESDPDDMIFRLQSSSGPDPPPQSPSIICDNVSWSMIKDAKLDYTRELIGSAFRIVDNPEVKSGCGCGVSFDLKNKN